MNRTPCVTDITVAAAARPVAWNSDVSRPVKPLAIMATSCAVRIVTPRARTDGGRADRCAAARPRHHDTLPATPCPGVPRIRLTRRSSGSYGRAMRPGEITVTVEQARALIDEQFPEW